MPRNKALFAVAVSIWVAIGLHALAQSSESSIKANAIEINSPTSLPTEIYPLVRDAKLITIGEMHGTNEAPQFTLGLVRLLTENKKSVLLGLEISEADQPDIDRYLKSGDLEVLKRSAFFQRAFQDGRSSRAMAELLKEVRKILGVQVVCFDPAESKDQTRDEKMADNLVKAYERAKSSVLVVLAGNIHAALTKGTPWNPEYRTMAFELLARDRSPFSSQNTVSIKQRYLGGSAWVCLSDKPCEVTTFADYPSPYSNAVSLQSYFLRDEKLFEGYSATYFVRRLTPSVPLKSKDLAK